MDHIRLSPRLQTVADFVPPCTCAADIGTDHGYLPVWLLQNGIAETAIAADIHAGPLANARQSAHAYDLTERFRFVLADGLRFRTPKMRTSSPSPAWAGRRSVRSWRQHRGCRRGAGSYCSRRARSRSLPTGYGAAASRSRMPRFAVIVASAILRACAWSVERAAVHGGAAFTPARRSAAARISDRRDPAADARTRRYGTRKAYAGSGACALDARLNELQTCLKEVKSWQS